MQELQELDEIVVTKKNLEEFIKLNEEKKTELQMGEDDWPEFIPNEFACQLRKTLSEDNINDHDDVYSEDSGHVSAEHISGTNTKRDGTFENQYDKSYLEAETHPEKKFIEDLWDVGKKTENKTPDSQPTAKPSDKPYTDKPHKAADSRNTGKAIRVRSLSRLTVSQMAKGNNGNSIPKKNIFKFPDRLQRPPTNKTTLLPIGAGVSRDSDSAWLE